jgi:lincosamide nucleotidyltransferase A/C/D/E
MPISAEEVVDLLDRLEAAGVEASVAGGWAVDALLGRVTREHGDLDLAVDASEIDHAIEALDTGGLSVEVDERPARLALGDGRRSVDLHPVRWEADGTGRQSTGAGGEFVYPPGSSRAVGRIGSRDVRCLTPELLVTFHLGYEPRDIDRNDMAALAERYGLELPEPYRGEATLVQ